MPDKPTDDQLSELYRSIEPGRSPRELDQRILAEARARVPARSYRMPRWLPVASAAGVVGLTMTLLYQTVTVEPGFTPQLEADDEAKMEVREIRLERSEATRVQDAPSALSAPKRSAADSAMKTNQDAFGGSFADEPGGLVLEQSAIVSDRDDRGSAAVAAEESVSAPAARTPYMAIDESGASLTAEAWLETIRETIEGGDLEQARLQIVTFQREYPDVPLPEDLQGILAEN